MNKLPFTCEHRNITYKEQVYKDEPPIAFGVKCVDCKKSMGLRYLQMIQEKLNEQYKMKKKSEYLYWNKN